MKSSNKSKRKNNADLRISADSALLTWLANTFGCSKEDAVAILVNATNKKDNYNNDFSET